MAKKEENMFAELRKQSIVDYVNKTKNVTVNELCEEYSVSPATVRNDLRELEEAGLLKRTHGGAICNRKATYELNTRQKEVECIEEKKAIAREAKKYIQKGDSIALDTGTTTFELAKLLTDIEDLTIITNDVQIAFFLESNSKANIIIAGGAVRKDFHCTSGKFALDMLSCFNVDKLFLAANAVSVKKGVCTPNIETSRIKRAMCSAADEIILLADSSKMGKASFVRFANIKELDLIITDDGIEEAMLEDVQKLGIDIEIVKIRTENK